jgi:hypothetical protein
VSEDRCCPPSGRPTGCAPQPPPGPLPFVSARRAQADAVRASRLALAVEEAAARLAQVNVPTPPASSHLLLATIELQQAVAARWARHLRSRLGLPEDGNAGPCGPAGGGA